MDVLNSSMSGSAGETVVSGKLFRFGVKVSKPFWNDDEVDLEIKDGIGDQSVNVPVQVKNVQFSNNRKRAYIQGLRKKYIERNQVLCLAIYNTQNDWLWFIPGSDKIKEEYESQSTWNKKHKKYADLESDDDVRIAVPKDGRSLLAKYKIEINDQEKISRLLDVLT